MGTASKRFAINVQGLSYELAIGESYIIQYLDKDISFHGLEAKIEDIHWRDEEGKTMFFIWVPEHQEDYLVSDEEIQSIMRKD